MSAKPVQFAPARTEAVMGTLVTIQAASRAGHDTDAAIQRAFHWFQEVESHCTRFDERSELMRLTANAGVPMAVSPLLFEAVQFAISVAEESAGAFDPTVGAQMASRGFNREHRSNEVVRSFPAASGVTYRDVVLDPDRGTILLKRPLTLDLGGVAKGLAVDMAVRELEPLGDFAIDAGGDLYLGGRNQYGEAWSTGVRHPRREGELIDRLQVSDQAVCTSGDYERRYRGTNGDGHHILDPRTGSPAHSVASATVVAPSAMLADAVATAVFVMGPDRGIQFLASVGVEGLIVTPQLERYATGGWPRA